MAVRIATLGVPRFMHGKTPDVLEVGETWQVVEKLTDRQRAVLRDFHGRFIQVHPLDRGALAEFGLAFVEVDKPLHDLTTTALAVDNPAAMPSSSSQATPSKPGKSTSKNGASGAEKDR